MTDLTDDEIAALPEDPGAAFVAGEKILRTRLEEALEHTEGSGEHYTLSYMNKVIALAIHFDIDEIAQWSNAIPGRHSWEEYSRFEARVDACIMQMRLTTVRRAREYSVVLNGATKQKLSHLLAQIRETVEKLEISSSKKDRLYKRINALHDEIDRERTGIHAFGALAMDVAADAAEVGEKLAPLLERIGAALGMAKRDEQSPAQLPAPRKRIEGPKSAEAKSKGFEKKLDDEIPF